MIASENRTGDDHATLPGLLKVLRRRRYVLVLPTLAGLGFGLASYGSAPVSYVSEAVLALDVRRVQALPTERVISPLPQDSPVLRTELDLIGSRMMASKVIARLETEGVDIREEELERGIPALVMETVGRLRVAAGALFQAAATPGPEPLPQNGTEDERVKIDRLLSNLRVSNDGRSYTIYIAFRASDPAYAAKVANAYAQSYLHQHVTIQDSATRQVSDWLGEKLVSLRAELEASEKAAEDFRQKAGLVQADGTTLQAQRVAALNSELVAARAALAGARARLDTVRSLMADGDVPALAEVLSSATIQALRADQVRLERRIDELRGSGAVRSAQLTMLDAEAASLREQMTREVQRVIDSLANEIAIAERKEASLQEAFDEAQRELAVAGQAEVAMGQLEREASANRTIYESFLVRYKQTIEQEGISSPEAQIISYAEPATARASPRLSTWLLLGLALGGGVGVAGAVLREATDRRPRFAGLLETATGVPVIGVVPNLSFGERRWISEQARNTSCQFGREMMSLRAAVGATPNRGSPVVMALASAYRGEGKTTLTLGLARSAVAAGVNTVIVDANLRDPMMEKALGAQATAFIDEVVGHPRALGDLLQKDPRSELRFIAARSGAVAPEALFASKGFQTLLGKLKRQFGLVLIDTPALQQAADAMALATSADRVLFVVRFDARRLEHTAASLRSLAACAKSPQGIVVNRVDRRFYAELAERPLRSVPASAPAGGAPPPAGIF